LGRRAAANAARESAVAVESAQEQARREQVEWEEAFKDVTECYQHLMLNAPTDEERRRLNGEYATKRTAYRVESVARGYRSPGLAIQMHQIMWVRWLEAAVEHEMEAREAFWELMKQASSDPLLREFRASLIAVTSAAHSVEALFGDIKYLIPIQKRRNTRHQVLRHAFRDAFGIPSAEDETLAVELAWLFGLRDSAAHPYTKSEPPQPHPAEIGNTGVEHSAFNAVTSGRALDAAFLSLRYAAAPPKPACRWIERWSEERGPYHNVVASLAVKRGGVSRPS